MTTLASDEKSTLVIIYTQNSLIRGEVITKESLRISIWLRTDGAPNFFHLHNAQMIFFGGGSIKSSNYSEIYVPTASVIGFHMAPPAQEPLDYEEGEKNRAVEIVTAGVGTFIFKGKVRFSAQSGLAPSLEMLKTWMSLYDVEIANPNLPQMPIMQVPMLLLDYNRVTFGLQTP